MENEVGKKYLPIGTVVLLKSGKRELMITGYGTIPAGEIYDKNGKVETKGITVFDYCGYFYPEGLINSDNIFAFNHDQIEKVCFKGYESEAFKKLNEKMIVDIENIRKKIEELTPKIEAEVAEKEAKRQLINVEGQ